jgi:hypothetical protein
MSAPVSWSDAHKFVGFFEKLDDHKLSVSPEVVQYWNHRFARKAFDLAERYVGHELECVAVLHVGFEEDDCELVFRSIPSVIGDAEVTPSHSLAGMAPACAEQATVARGFSPTDVQGRSV